VSAPAQTGAAPIPFRAEHGGEGGQLAGGLLTAVVLLALASVALLHARRKGWLRRWIPAGAAAADKPVQASAGVLLHRQRLSRQTTLYVVDIDGQRIAITESTAQVSTQLLPTAGREADSHDS
jgi:hypothetical protein